MEEHVLIPASDKESPIMGHRNEISLIKASSFICICFATFLGIYINFPPPQLTKDLQRWLGGGNIFEFQDKSNRLSYEIFYKDDDGDGSSGTIVCLHGFPTSSLDWIKIHNKLKEQFSRVITPDFIGFGFSQKPIVHHIIMSDPEEIIEKEHNYSISQQADIVEALLEQINVTTFHILAHDYGDSVAQELVFRENKRSSVKNKISSSKILSLGLLNGGIIPDAHKPLLVQKLLLYPFLDWFLSSLGNFWIFKYSFKTVFGPKSQPDNNDCWNWWVQLRHKDGNLILGKLLSYIPERQIRQNDWIGALKETQIPIAMIYGPADPVNPPPFADYYKEQFPRSNLSVLDDIGHYVQWEAPEQMMEIYSSFIDNL